MLNRWFLKKKDTWNHEIKNLAMIKTKLRARWMTNTYPEMIFAGLQLFLCTPLRCIVFLLLAAQRSAIKLSYRLRIKLINTKSVHRSNDLNFSIWLQDFM